MVGRKPIKVGRKPVKRLGENQIKIIALILTDNKITTKKIAKLIEISSTAVENNITKLKLRGLLKRIGPSQGRTLGGEG